MASDPALNARTARVVNAFAQDGYDATAFIHDGKLGVRAQHRLFRNYDPDLPRYVYYVEGSPRQMGHLMGLMARNEVRVMTTEFVTGVFEHFLRTVPGPIDEVVEWLLQCLLTITLPSVRDNVPASFHEEIAGLRAGCADTGNPAAGPPVSVSERDLWCLNAGFDCLLSMAYSGRIHLHLLPLVGPVDLPLPIGCNAFSAFGDAANGGHYFGRDFMFDTGGVFQNVACMVIYNPDPATGARPHVSVTAPGIVGSIAAMNDRGVAAGVDMLPAANVNVDDVGLNSLLLVREAVQKSASALSAVGAIQAARRGVPWLYVIADGANDRACAVEAGCSTNDPDFYRWHVDPFLIEHGLVPPPEFFHDHPSGPSLNGMMARWDNYEHPTAALEPFNVGLWHQFFNGQDPLPGTFGERGYFARKLPGYAPFVPFLGPCYCFAPQRERRADLLVACNHAVLPEMRLCALNAHIAKVTTTQMDDIHWRYDELNHQILDTLDSSGHVDFEAAQRLIDFLSPLRTFYRYYTADEHYLSQRTPRRPVIPGSVTACDLKARVIRTQVGYYPVDVPDDGLTAPVPGAPSPEWLQITLPNYL